MSEAATAGEGGVSVPDTRFEALRDAHVAMLSGSFLDGIGHGPGGACYVRSRAIPDPTLNFACGVTDAESFAWAVAAARGCARAPAFLARDAGEAAVLRGLVAPQAEFAAAWMIATTQGGAAPADTGTVLDIHAGPVPPESFHEVFGHLSDDPRALEHVRRHYLPALRDARKTPGVDALHLVLNDRDGPAACASLYIRDGLAGLYNVSTRANRQRRGLGAAITTHALEQAGLRGASRVALQCPAGGFVEALYARAGFLTIHTPILICTEAP